MSFARDLQFASEFIRLAMAVMERQQRASQCLMCGVVRPTLEDGEGPTSLKHKADCKTLRAMYLGRELEGDDAK